MIQTSEFSLICDCGAAVGTQQAERNDALPQVRDAICPGCGTWWHFSKPKHMDERRLPYLEAVRKDSEPSDDAATSG